MEYVNCKACDWNGTMPCPRHYTEPESEPEELAEEASLPVEPELG